MSQMHLRELRCCGLYMVMVNNQPTDCCGLAFAGSPGPLETHLARLAPGCRDPRFLKLRQAQRAHLVSQERPELAHPGRLGG